MLPAYQEIVMLKGMNDTWSEIEITMPKQYIHVVKSVVYHLFGLPPRLEPHSFSKYPLCLGSRLSHVLLPKVLFRDFMIAHEKIKHSKIIK